MLLRAPSLRQINIAVVQDLQQTNKLHRQLRRMHFMAGTRLEWRMCLSFNCDIVKKPKHASLQHMRDSVNSGTGRYLVTH
jgi:hypothetical protein